MVRSRIAVDHVKVGANLTDFPLYVNLAHLPGAFWSTVVNGGGDIRCYDASENELAREVVSCSTGTSTGELYIKTNLSSSVDTTIWIDVDGSSSDYGVTATYGRNAVWASGFVSVYHMNDEPVANLPDSTGSWPASPSGMSSGDLVAGKVGGGLNFSGSSTLNVSTSSIPTGNAARTTSIWIYPGDEGNRTIWGMGTSGIGELWEVSRYSGSLILHWYGGGNDTIGISAPVSSGQWSYCAVSFDGTSVRIYVDGVLKGTQSAAFSTGTDAHAIGGAGFFSQWSGSLDEARLSSTARSADWIAAEYSNQNNPATFYSIVGSKTLTGIQSITGVQSIIF